MTSIHLVQIAPTSRADATPSRHLSAYADLDRSTFRRYGGSADLAGPPQRYVAALSPRPETFAANLLLVEGDLPSDLPTSRYGYPLVAGSSEGILLWPDETRIGETEPSQIVPDPEWNYRVLGQAQVFGSFSEELDQAFFDLTVADHLIERSDNGTWRATPQPEGDVAASEVQQRLMDAIYHIAAAESRHKLYSWPGAINADDGDPGALHPSTGTGAIVPGLDEEFLLSQGFVLEQVERASTLDLPVDPAILDHYGAMAEAAASSRYDIVTFAGTHVPDEWRDAVIKVFNIFDTEAPSAGFEAEEANIDAERWVRSEDRAAAIGTTSIYSLAIERETGELAGLTNLEVPRDVPTTAYQDSTIVLKPHRGHRLGWWLKVTNLRELQRRYPERTTITTWNAAENSWMLDINVKLGFYVSMASTNWQRDTSK